MLTILGMECAPEFPWPALVSNAAADATESSPLRPGPAPLIVETAVVPLADPCVTFVYTDLAGCDPAQLEDESMTLARERVGTVVRDRWRLDALLGVGGMAAVYAATHRNGKRVAVKILHPTVSASLEARQRFVDEAYAANRVGHPGVVSVLDDDIAEDGCAFLVMDLLEGENLDMRLLRLGPMSPDDSLFVIERLLDILAAAHDKGIIHRDVKPDNIFLTIDKEVRLLDFGIARLETARHPRTTQSGSTLGTPAFMPPEQARGHWDVLDGRTDLWAVGATLFVLLTGMLVHEAPTVNEELLLAMTARARSIRTVLPDLAPVIVEVVDKALAFEQAGRWPDARAMQAAVCTARSIICQRRPSLDPLVGRPTFDGAASVAGTPPVMLARLQPSVLLAPGARRRIALRGWRSALYASAAGLVLVVAVPIAVHASEPVVAPALIARRADLPALLARRSAQPDPRPADKDANPRLVEPKPAAPSPSIGTVTTHQKRRAVVDPLERRK